MKDVEISTRLMVFCLLLVIVGVTQGQNGNVAGRLPAIVDEQQVLTGSAAPKPQGRPPLTPGPTEGPPRPTLMPRPPSTADVCVRLASDPASAVTPSEIVTYRLVAQNKGQSTASSVRISLPLASDAQTILDASFSSPSAWVTDVLTNAIKMDLGRIDSTRSVTATLRLHVSPNVRLGSVLTTRASLKWTDQGSGGAGLSNGVTLVVANASSSSPTTLLEIIPSTGSPTTVFAIMYNGFASKEHISLWYHQPDGNVVALAETQADAQGEVSYHMAANPFAVGRYLVVAHGACSQVSAVGTFTITSP